MKSLKEVHSLGQSMLKKRFTLNPVPLKYPFPERPLRTLGLVKADGDVFSSEKFSRLVFFRLKFPFYLAVRSIFLRPRMELDLPIFTCEIVIMGKKRMFMLDIQRTGESKGHDDSELTDRLIKIRDRYPALLEKKTKLNDEIQSTLSKAACQVRITEERDAQALDLFSEYLEIFAEMVEKATPLSGNVLDQARQAFEGYLKTMVDHDPGVKGYKMLFGKEGGFTRALDIFFDR